MLIDLQLHSKYSDGYLTPTELVRFISKYNIKVASLTDHNTVGGLDEFKLACKKARIKAIPGVELYVRFGSKKFNILWYNMDYNNPVFHNLLRDSQVRRKSRVRIFLKDMVRRGFKIDIDKVLDKYTHYIPLNRVIDDIRSVRSNLSKIKKELKVHNPREEEIIKKFFYNPEIGKLEQTYLNIKRVMELKKEIGGKIIFCHPCKYRGWTKNVLKDLRRMGLDGIEVLSPHHSIGAVMHSQHIAEELDMIQTGGSDFHRFEGKNRLIQHSHQWFSLDSNRLKRIKEIIG